MNIVRERHTRSTPHRRVEKNNNNLIPSVMRPSIESTSGINENKTPPSARPQRKPLARSSTYYNTVISTTYAWDDSYIVIISQHALAVQRTQSQQQNNTGVARFDHGRRSPSTSMLTWREQQPPQEKKKGQGRTNEDWKGGKARTSFYIPWREIRRQVFSLIYVFFI